MKRAAIYDPYFSILGGAERYILSLASCLSSYDEIIIFGATKELLAQAAEKFGIATEKIIAKPWPKSRSQRIKMLTSLHLFFYVTDGSLFFSPARKNVLLIQSPAHTPIKTLSNRIKLFSWHRLICYSQFMQKIILHKLNREAEILFVPITIPKKSMASKENIILSVGRFFPNLHNKKQLEMVQVFKELLTEGLQHTTLYLVGSVDPGGENYLASVEKAAAGLPVKILTHTTFTELEQLYDRAKVYWHAAGFGEDVTAHPEKAEHFGVVTLEAMAHSVVPLVYKAGGQVELVDDNDNGFLWETAEALKSLTKNVLLNEELRQTMSAKALEKSANYTMPAFCTRLYEILEK